MWYSVWREVVWLKSANLGRRLGLGSLNVDCLGIRKSIKVLGITAFFGKLSNYRMSDFINTFDIEFPLNR